MPSLIKSLLNNQDETCSYGGYVRDYIYVKDVASAIVTCLFSDYTGFVNVAGGAETSIQDIANIIIEKTNTSAKVHFKSKEESGLQPEYIAGDVSLLKSLGWKQEYSIEQGLAEEIEFFKGKND